MVWYAQAGVFVLLGLGFHTLHNAFQVQVPQSQTARGAARSMQPDLCALAAASAARSGACRGPVKRPS
jgi:hypothetical protein